MKIRAMAWALVVMAAFFAAVGAAPFGAGAFFPACSLPVAALVAWRGLVVAPLLVLGLALVGFWGSVIPVGEIVGGWGLPVWLVGWTGVLVAGVWRTATAPRAS